MHNNAMHAKPDLRVILKWMIAGSGSVIADVMPLNKCRWIRNEEMDFTSFHSLFSEHVMYRLLSAHSKFRPSTIHAG